LAITDAFLNGADFISIQIQMTSDKVLIVNSAVCLGQSTTARSKFSSKPTLKKNITLSNEVCVNDYLVPDFKLAEIKALKHVQKYP